MENVQTKLRHRSPLHALDMQALHTTGQANLKCRFVGGQLRRLFLLQSLVPRQSGPDRYLYRRLHFARVTSAFRLWTAMALPIAKSNWIWSAEHNSYYRVEWFVGGKYRNIWTPTYNLPQCHFHAGEYKYALLLSLI